MQTKGEPVLMFNFRKKRTEDTENENPEYKKTVFEIEAKNGQDAETKLRQLMDAIKEKGGVLEDIYTETYCEHCGYVEEQHNPLGMPKTCKKCGGAV